MDEPLSKANTYGRRSAVLGAGALGLTIAYRLAQHGDSVTVIEREQEPGGLAAGFQVAARPDGSPVYLEKFYHHLFRADHAAVNLIEELGLGHRLVWPTPTSTMLRDGRVQRLDGAVALLRLAALPPVDRVRMGAVLAYLKLEKGYQRLEGKTAEQWLTRWMGHNAYRVFAEPLLQAKFGEYSGKIAMPWFWSRVHLRSTELGYLLGGFQQLYATLAERIKGLGGDLQFGTAVTGIGARQDGGIAVSTGGEPGRFDRVISTLPSRVTIGLTAGLDDDFARRYGGGAALSAHCLILEMNRSLSDAYWIAVNDPGYPFLAVVEHTNYIPPSEYGGKRLLYVGNYLPPRDPIFSKPKEELLATFVPYLQRINPDFSERWVTNLHAFAAPFAQPIVTTNFRRDMPPHKMPIPNLYLANMFQIYPQDRGQNYSITMAERMIRLLERDA
jgi:protoporphyrinogen oxidase